VAALAVFSVAAGLSVDGGCGGLPTPSGRFSKLPEILFCELKEWAGWSGASDARL